MKQNRNNFQCYYNNKGYCKFRSECCYQHYKESCQKTICKDQECKFRHPNICKFKSDGNFNKKNICFFKNETTKVMNEIEALYKKVSILKDKISHLKKEIKTKEDVLE